MSFRGDKRAQGLSTNAIILIILGVIVLAVLAIGFTFGWSVLKDKISPSNNVQTIVDACSSACITNSQYDFCTAQRELKTEDAEVKDVTCYYLAQNRTEFGVKKCAAVSCSDSILLDEEDAANQFSTQDTLDENVGIEKDQGLCSEELNKGKRIFVLNTDKDALLSVMCKAETA